MNLSQFKSTITSKLESKVAQKISEMKKSVAKSAASGKKGSGTLKEEMELDPTQIPESKDDPTEDGTSKGYYSGYNGQMSTELAVPSRFQANEETKQKWTVAYKEGYAKGKTEKEKTLSENDADDAPDQPTSFDPTKVSKVHEYCESRSTDAKKQYARKYFESVLTGKDFLPENDENGNTKDWEVTEQDQKMIQKNVNFLLRGGTSQQPVNEAIEVDMDQTTKSGGAYVAFASDLRWPPGKWPQEVEFGGQTLRLEKVDKDGCAHYRNLIRTAYLQVFND